MMKNPRRITMVQRRLIVDGARSRQYAARPKSVVLGRKSDQLRHAARDAGKKPKSKVAGALKNGLSDGAEEQQETKVGEQVIQIDVHENSGDYAPPLAGEDRLALHADRE